MTVQRLSVPTVQGALLVVLMLISLAMSASLPRAFGDLGLWVGGGYAHGHARELLWLGSVCVDLAGGVVGASPVSQTRECPCRCRALQKRRCS